MQVWKTRFFTLLECKSITDRVATLPGRLENLEFNNLRIKKPGVRKFWKNLGILTFLIFSVVKLRFTTYLKSLNLFV